MRAPESGNRGIGRWCAYFLLPFLMAVYPVLFHYGNNSGILSPAEIAKQLPLFLGIAVGAYMLFAVVVGRRTPEAANAAFIFLLFFHTYGPVYDGLRSLDVIRVEHYTLLPVYILLGGYAAWIVGRIHGRNAAQIWKGAALVLGALTAFNLLRILPVEIRKAEIRNQKVMQNPGVYTTDKNGHPDIYYIVFDEMTGFEALREYWKYEAVDDFADFLKQRGFYVAESSRAETTQTFYELASRLNYREYPYSPSDPDRYWGEYLPAMGNSRAMQYLKGLGYTTIVFDEYPVGFMPFEADVVYTDPAAEMVSWNSIFNDFGILVMENTMLKPALGLVKVNDAATMAHARRIFFAEQNLIQPDIPSPKFVYVHLLIPHAPFLFDEHGNFTALEDMNDWDKYLGTYVYSVQIAETMIANILSSRNGGNDAVIILQSDHGARNLENESGAVQLIDFPGQYSFLIVNAIRMPGCDTSVLTQDMNPINTFPIIFNCYFDAKIPLQ